MFNMKTHVSIKLVNIISKTPRQNHHPPTRPITKKPFFFEVDNDMEADTHTRVQAMVGGDTHQQSTLILSIDAALLDPGHASSSIRHFIRDTLAGAPHPPPVTTLDTTSHWFFVDSSGPHTCLLDPLFVIAL